MPDPSDALGTYAPPRPPADPKADALAQAERAHLAGHIDWQAIAVIRKALRPAAQRLRWRWSWGLGDRRHLTVVEVSRIAGRPPEQLRSTYLSLQVLAAARLVKWDFKFRLDEGAEVVLDLFEARKVLLEQRYVHPDTGKLFEDVVDRLVPVFTPEVVLRGDHEATR